MKPHEFFGARGADYYQKQIDSDPFYQRLNKSLDSYQSRPFADFQRLAGSGPSILDHIGASYSQGGSGAQGRMQAMAGQQRAGVGAANAYGDHMQDFQQQRMQMMGMVGDYRNQLASQGLQERGQNLQAHMQHVARQPVKRTGWQKFMDIAGLGVAGAGILGLGDLFGLGGKSGGGSQAASPYQGFDYPRLPAPNPDSIYSYQPQDLMRFPSGGYSS